MRFRCYLIVSIFIGVLVTLSIQVLADPEYVVITTDTFDDAFQNLTHWKETRGKYTIRENLTTHIELLSNITSNSSFWDNGYHDICSDNTTLSQIRNYVNYTYTNHSTEYILLGGHNDTIPTYRKTYPGCPYEPYPYDKWFVNVSGDDGSELLIGRIPCQQVCEVDNWTARMEIYENCTNESWANSILLTANNGRGPYCNQLFSIDSPFGGSFGIGERALYAMNCTVHKYYLRDRGPSTDSDNHFYFPETVTSQIMYYVGHAYSLSEDPRRATLTNNSNFKAFGFENLTYPYIHVSANCGGAEFQSDASFHELLFGGPNLDSNRTAIAYCGTNESGSNVLSYDTLPKYIAGRYIETSEHLGTPFSDITNAANLHYLGCPETRPYIVDMGVKAHINCDPSEATDSDPTQDNYKLCMGGEERVYKEQMLTLWEPIATINGTANGTSFSNYSLQLLWWDNYTFWNEGDKYDMNPDYTTSSNEPSNSCYNCFDIADCNSPVSNGILGTLNLTKVQWMGKGVYIIRLTVNSTDDKQITHDKFISGMGYLEGIVTVGGVEASINTDVTVKVLNYSSMSYEEHTVKTKNHDGHTGYYNFSFWTCNIKPSSRTPSVTSYVNVACGEGTNSDVYILGEGPEYMTLDINQDIRIASESPVNGATDEDVDISNVSVLINASGGSFNWTIEGSFLTNNNSDSDSNGTKTATIPAELDYDTTYTWYVNVTDGVTWCNKTFTFRTRDLVATHVTIEYALIRSTATATASIVFNIMGFMVTLSAIISLFVVITKNRRFVR